MRRLLLTAVLALVAMAALAAPSSAGGGAFADPRGDLFGSSDGSLDIVRTSFGHSDGRIVHTVGLAGNAPNPSSQQIPRLYLQPSNRANGTSECALFVGRHRGQLGVFTCGYGDRIASARIQRTSARTIRYSFTPSAIGNPRSYTWAAVTAATNSTTGGAYRADRAPSADSTFFTHELR